MHFLTIMKILLGIYACTFLAHSVWIVVSQSTKDGCMIWSFNISYLCIVLFFILYTKNWTQGVIYIKQVFYCWGAGVKQMCIVFKRTWLISFAFHRCDQTLTKTKLGEKRVYFMALREVRAGTHTGAEAGNTQWSCSLVCSPWLAQLAFLHNPRAQLQHHA